MAAGEVSCIRGVIAYPDVTWKGSSPRLGRLCRQVVAPRAELHCRNRSPGVRIWLDQGLRPERTGRIEVAEKQNGYHSNKEEYDKSKNG